MNNYGKTMADIKFRLYEYDLPKTVGKGGTICESNEDALYHDTGKVFSVSEEEASLAYREIYGTNLAGADTITNMYVIPRVMLSKVYGFSGNFVHGWSLNWTTPNEEGYIGAKNAKYWHIKKVV